MILAAGRGERLRPLTDTVPKAMVKAGGKPLIAWHLERLAAAGYGEAVINVSHLAERIVERLGDGERYGVRIAYSREREPLETAGGIAKARALLGEAPFLLVNADIYCEFDFRRPARVSLGAQAGAPRAGPQPAAPQPPAISRSRRGRSATAPGRATLMPASQSCRPRMVAGVAPRRKAPLAPLLYAAAARRLVGGELYRGVWQDVGTRERLAELEAHLASGRPAMKPNDASPTTSRAGGASPQAIGEGVALVPTAPERLRNRDTHIPYRFDSDFYYLTGFAEPEAALVSSPAKAQEHPLLPRPKNVEREIWDGFRYGPQARARALRLRRGLPDRASSTRRMAELLAEPACAATTRSAPTPSGTRASCAG